MQLMETGLPFKKFFRTVGTAQKKQQQILFAAASCLSGLRNCERIHKSIRDQSLDLLSSLRLSLPLFLSLPLSLLSLGGLAT